MIRELIGQQAALSRDFDRKFLPARFLIDGNSDYLKDFLPKLLAKTRSGAAIYDVGCGKNPALTLAEKHSLKATITGVDLSRGELLRAPAGILDECIEADICGFRGKRDGDLVLCQAVLEHVPDVDGAFAAMASMLREGGLVMLFVPSRNAVFARLNNLLPQSVKHALLHGIFTKTRRDQGFPSYYNLCTPRDFRALAAKHGFVVEEIRTYYKSSYFTFFFPLYLVWRAWILLFESMSGEQAAETFCMKLRRV